MLQHGNSAEQSTRHSFSDARFRGSSFVAKKAVVGQTIL